MVWFWMNAWRKEKNSRSSMLQCRMSRNQEIRLIQGTCGLAKEDDGNVWAET